MDDHNLNEEQFNKWKQLVEIMGEESGNVAMYNWVMSHLKNENGLTEKDLENYQQVKLKELRKKSFEKRSSEDFCRWLLGEKVVSDRIVRKHIVWRRHLGKYHPFFVKLINHRRRDIINRKRDK